MKTVSPLHRGIEFAFIEQRGADIGADVEHLFLQRALAQRHQLEAAQIGERHDDAGGDEHRHRQLARL